jgi:hypothetical protein
VLFRTVLSFSLEIEGVAPWRRAGLSGTGAVERAGGPAGPVQLALCSEVRPAGQVVRRSCPGAGRGMKMASTNPTRANPPMTTSATANGVPPGIAAPTRTEPASATPSEEPRFDTLRDTLEMSPWTASGELDCTRLTDAVSMIPIPAPIRNRPGMKVQTAESSRAIHSRRPSPTTVSPKPPRISRRWECQWASRSAMADVASTPIVAGSTA